MFSRKFYLFIIVSKSNIVCGSCLFLFSIINMIYIFSFPVIDFFEFEQHGFGVQTLDGALVQLLFSVTFEVIVLLSQKFLLVEENVAVFLDFLHFEGVFVLDLLDEVLLELFVSGHFLLLLLAL